MTEKPGRPRVRAAALSLLLLCCLAVFLAAPPPPAAQPGTPRTAAPANLDFEQGEPGQPPPGWTLAQTAVEAGYSAAIEAEKPESGARCAVLSAPSDLRGFGNLMQSLDAAPYRGKRVRYRAAVRIQVEAGGRAGLWLRVDRPGGATGFFDNMQQRPITSAEWARYEIVGDVAADAEALNLGLLFRGKGRAWIDSASLEVIGEAGAGNEPARALTGRGLENVVAFTRLLGYVRFFHPSDQAAAADWDRVALAGVQAAEPAADAAALARTLQDFFHPLAPTVRVFPTGQAPPLPAELSRPAAGSARVVSWRHFGVGLSPDPTQRLYRSERLDGRDAAPPADTKARPAGDPGKPFLADLGGGVSALVPLALYADERGTLPHAASNGAGAAVKSTGKPDGFLPSGNDRTTRLAAVALAWNVFQHFYPYFEEVRTDWPAVLRPSLRAAATDADEIAFGDTLRRLVAALQDGHGNVSGPSRARSHVPPLTWDWIEDRLVVTYVAVTDTSGIRPGDVVLAIDGKPVREVLEAAEALISSPTPQWRRYIGLREIASGPEGAEVRLDIQPREGQPFTAVLRRTATLRGPGSIEEPRPEKVAEIRPGIFYIDVERASDGDVIAVLDRLAAAKGVIFDVRGYPSVSTNATLAHLTDQTMTSARWNVPVVTRPDREGMELDFSNWPVKPAQPRFQGKVAFLTDGRAISYAETYMGIVEHYKLGEIVGGPTAGTNGNVNPFRLPGGYTVTWTGMKVLKHDGSRHHGVGIQPTVPVSRSIRGLAEGRDEVLEKAIEIVSRP